MVLAAGCVGGNGDEPGGRGIEDVLQEHTDSLMALPGVVGTGIGLCADSPCIEVYVERKTPTLLEQIPTELEGHKVDVVETGPIRALEPD